MAGDAEVLFDVIVIEEGVEDDTDGVDEISIVGVVGTGLLPPLGVKNSVMLAADGDPGVQPLSLRCEIKDDIAVDFWGPSTDPGTVCLIWKPSVSMIGVPNLELHPPFADDTDVTE